MQTTNPFPGMNPFLEGSWPDVHTTLIGFIREGMSEELPPDLSARAEEEVIVGHESDEPLTRYRADVAVSEVWRSHSSTDTPPEHERPRPARR